MRREKDPIIVASRAPSVEPVLRIFTQRHDKRDVGACESTIRIWNRRKRRKRRKAGGSE